MGKRLTEEERAELIAYLDDEVVGDARRAIEAKLTRDPVWRAEADSLKRTWDLLDYLPSPEPKADFTQRTLSRVGPIPRPAPKASPRLRVAFVGAAWAASLLLALGVGYLSCRSSLPSGPGEAELTRDLRLIENKRFYDPIEDFDFLQELAEPDLFGEDAIGG